MLCFSKIKSSIQVEIAFVTKKCYFSTFSTNTKNIYRLKSILEPKAGEKRVASMFRVRLSTQHLSTLDVLFSKAKETKAVHVDIGQGTNFEVKIPWIITDQGYQTKLSGTLMMIEATTSLPFRDLLR